MCAAKNMNVEPSVQTPPASTPKKSSLHQAYVYAEKLNTSSVLCIEFGQYRRAEISLTKALHLARAHSKETTITECRCDHCTLDGCIRFTEDSHHHSALRARALKIGKRTHKICTECHFGSHGMDQSFDVSRPDCFIYKRAIGTQCLPIFEGHYMGSTLSLIIAFNLALSKHLRAIEEGDQDAGKTNKRRRALLERSLRLYEVIYDCLCNRNREEKKASQGNLYKQTLEDTGVRFKMILCNNLCHVHRCLDESYDSGIPVSPSEYKHRKYLEGLLSALMYALQRKVFQTSVERSDRLENASNIQSIEHEGFWRRVTHLILTAQCADAA